MVDQHTGRVSSRIHVFIFSAILADATGTLQESDEMRPQWFAFSDVPLGQMWADDEHWLPQLLQGHDVVGEFLLADKSTLVEHDVQLLHAGQFAALTATGE